MRVVADSLKGEIQAEFDRLIDYSPAVKLLPKVRPTCRPEHHDPSGPVYDTTDYAADMVVHPPVEDAPWQTLHYLSDNESQQRILQEAANAYRALQSNLTGARTNHEWRSERCSFNKKQYLIPFGCYRPLSLIASLPRPSHHPNSGNLGA